jgi:hypothetical protein
LTLAGRFPMTTSELWAKAEAEKRYPFDITDPERDHFYWARRDAAAWGVLHVLSLLESEQAVEAGATAIDEVPYEDFGVPAPSEVLARAALAAVVAAITRGGSENG